MKNIDSFITWIGGKKSLREEILKRFPKDYERYIEVFGGGASILFGKSITKFEVYNDFNNNLTNMFKVVKEKPMEFLKELDFLPINSRIDFEALINHLNHDIYGNEYIREELEIAEKYLTEPQFKEVKNVLETKCENIEVMRAVIFYKIIRYSYGSGCKSVSCQPQNIRKTFQNIHKANRRLQNVFIENKDFEALIKQYDRDASFFYVDPPYYETVE